MRKQRKKKYIPYIFIVILFLCIVSIFGSKSETENQDYPKKEEVVLETKTEADVEPEVVEEIPSDAETDASFDFNDYEFQISDVPSFSVEPYCVLNNNIPDFGDVEISTEEFEYYSNLDSLGRCGYAIANIGVSLMPTEERGAIGQIKPSGWHTIKYNELIDGNYLYNRCHLIGYQLAGENANELNLITGTRYLNVQGMLPFEEQVANYVKNTGNHVLYRVTPIFEEENLVASGVVIEAFSIEDIGKGVCFNVYCYNIQPGISIDYLTGDSWVSDEQAEIPTDSSTQTEAVDDAVDPIVQDSSAQTFFLNTNTKKFHYPYCDSVSEMKEKNKKEVFDTRENIINMGYKPCKRCNP